MSFLEPSRTVVVSWVLYNCWIGTWLRDFEALRSVAGMTFPQADVVETGWRGYVLGVGCLVYWPWEGACIVGLSFLVLFPFGLLVLRVGRWLLCVWALLFFVSLMGS